MRLRLSWIAATVLLLLSLSSAVGAASWSLSSSSSSADATTEATATPQQAVTSSSSIVVVPVEFLNACTEGDIAAVQAFVKSNPDYLNGLSADGESCLHVVGIYGHAAITELVLKAGADPNIRSTFSGGLRMTPLSWNVYGGHVETCKVLLQHGAHVNLDFDAAAASNNGKDGGATKTKVTVYDVLMDILDRSGSNDAQKQQQPQQQQHTANADTGMDRYLELKQVLEKHGAMRYAELASTEL